VKLYNQLVEKGTKKIVKSLDIQHLMNQRAQFKKLLQVMFSQQERLLFSHQASFNLRLKKNKK
jgi:hypothetical protein